MRIQSYRNAWVRLCVKYQINELSDDAQAVEYAVCAAGSHHVQIAKITETCAETIALSRQLAEENEFLKRAMRQLKSDLDYVSSKLREAERDDGN